MRPSLANWDALGERLGRDCLRVATYNLHGCVGGDGWRDAERVARVIAELGCDTVGLQEVYGLDVISARLDMQALAGPPYVWHGRHVGNALLTRRPVRSFRHHDYTWRGREPRSLLDAELEVAGLPVRVLVTHFGVLPSERQYQVKKLVQLLREAGTGQPFVLLGDINEWLPLSRPLLALHRLLGHSPGERTFPARWPLFALDRVWAHPRRSLLAVEAHRSPLAMVASDHLPLRALVAGAGPLAPGTTA